MRSFRARLRASGSVIAGGVVVPPPTTPILTLAFAIPTGSIAEGEAGSKTATRTLTRTGPTGSLTVNLTYGGTADGADYAGPVSVTFGSGVMSASVIVTIYGDAAIEPDETIVVTALEPVSGATASTTITIANDDASAVGTPVAIPADFALASMPMAISRTGSGSGSTFSTNYAPATKRPAIASTIYVAPAGTANGAGTQADPVPSVAMAIAMGNATGAPYAVEIAAGEYKASSTHARTVAPAATYVAPWYNATPTQDCAIYCPAGRAIMSQPLGALAWAATSDPNIWKATAANTATRWVVDKATLDETGVAVGLDQVRTVADATNPIAEINAAWTAARGASYVRTTSNEIWVRLPDNRQADANVFGLRDFSSGAGVLTAPAAPRTIWMENLSFWGSRTPFKVVAGANPVDVYASSCHFLYGGSNAGGGSDGAGAFSFEGGPGELIMKDCVASFSHLDGFSYHGLSGAVDRTTCPVVYEIGCKSRSAGWTGGLTNNGSTIHEYCVAVRVNGDYRAADRAIHDVNRAHSWNLGCVSGSRRGQDGTEQSAAFAVGHPTDGLPTRMWLDACTVAGTPQFPTETYAGAFLSYANLAFVPVAGVTAPGTVQAYAA